MSHRVFVLASSVPRGDAEVEVDGAIHTETVVEHAVHFGLRETLILWLRQVPVLQGRLGKTDHVAAPTGNLHIVDSMGMIHIAKLSYVHQAKQFRE